MRKIFLLSLLILLILPAPALAANEDLPAAQGSPGEVIALINSYRAENGLPAYVENGILAQIAQGQADYLASQVTTSDIHAGPGGSRPRDRAYAAGYGGGQTIFVSEIAKYGMSESPSSAVAWWKTSQIHNDTMLASTYIEIGAGVATDGNGRYYYIAVTGYIAGGTYTPGTGTTGGASPTIVAAPVMIPVTKAEPQEDGSVVHIIRTGQTLWTLSAVYEVPLQDLLTLNEMPEWAVVHPGDEVMILPPGSVAVEPLEEEITEEPTQAAPPTSEPTAEIVAALQNTPVAPESAQVNISPQQEAKAQNATVQVVVIVALVSILGVIAASFFIQRPQLSEPNENDPFAPID
jgi:uncharacterized protein YkwD